MLTYNLGDRVEAWSTNIGEEGLLTDVITPEYQAHSTNVAVIPAEAGSTYGVDTLITDNVGVRIGVRTADCVPVLLYDTRCQVVAAIHSGWKGTAHNIIAHTITRMREQFGCDTHDIRAVIGPCIHVEAFEVGDEVYQAFRDNGYESYCVRMANPYSEQQEVKWHIDLPCICQAQLTKLCVPDIYTAPFCTYRCHDTFYSYRYTKSPSPHHRIITSIMLTK